MSLLDQNLFTLNIVPNDKDSNVLDLVEPSGTVHYHKERIHDTLYKINIYEPLSGSLLATASAPSATSKAKTIELFNPTLAVELKYIGTISFRWGFQWEGHDFEWKREECYIIRKPDPPVLVAVTKEPAGRIKTSVIQMLDYNINRFDIHDKKGLEILILTALLTFGDSSDAHRTPTLDTANTPPATSRKGSGGPVPTPPPKPAPKTGVERIAEIQTNKGAIVNEVTVEDEGPYKDYAKHCAALLQDDAMLFISIRSATAEQVPKVLQVVEQTKRIRHKSGVSDELHQYVVYDTGPQGPQRINLDGDGGKGKGKGKSKEDKEYTPPKSLTVHLSKIPMPELQPRASGSGHTKAATQPASRDKAKERTKDAKRNADDRRKAEAKMRKRSPSPQHARTQSHAPSPAQLMNPGLYSAPPPVYHHSRPPPGAAPPRPPSGYFGSGYAASYGPPNVGPPPPHMQSPTASRVTGWLDKLRS